MTFALGDEGPDAAKVLADLQARTRELLTKIESAGGQAETQMCGASTSVVAGGKVASDDPAIYSVRVDGSITIPLAPAQDYWARSRLVAALSAVTRGLALASKDTTSKREVAFSELRPVVKDPEAHRDTLLKRWTARAHAFAAAAQSEGAPLSVVECSPPGDVTQRVVSLEEIALSLPVQCKLDVVARRESAPAP